VREDNKFLDMILQVQPIKSQIVQGTDQENALRHILRDQLKLVDSMT
jgi:hypothetical protein